MACLVAVSAVSLMLRGGGALADDGTVVFENTKALLDAGGFAINYRSKLEFGDEIVLGPGPRQLTSFTFGPTLLGNSAAEASAVLRIYANDGPDVNPGAQTVRAPGTLLWDSGSFLVTSAATAVTLSLPNVPVPDSFTWTIQYTTTGNNDLAGLVIANDPTVGKSFNDFWERDAVGTWGTKVVSGSGAKANFLAQATAVPEPGTVALAAAGFVMMVVMGVRRRVCR